MLRIREQSAKGRYLFDAVVADYHRQLIHKHQLLESLISKADDWSLQTFNELSNHRLELECQFKDYEAISTDFMSYLSRNRSVEGETELSSHRVVYSALHDRYNMAMMNIDSQLAPIPEGIPTPDMPTVSTFSTTDITKTHTPLRPKRSSSKYSLSHSSKNSSVTSLCLKQRANLEAAKIRLKSAEREAELLRQQATIQVNLSLLSAQRDFEEAQARHRAILDGLDDNASHSQDFDDNFESESSMRTSRYVEEQNKRLELSSVLPISQPEMEQLQYSSAIISSMVNDTNVKTTSEYSAVSSQGILLSTLSISGHASRSTTLRPKCTSKAASYACTAPANTWNTMENTQNAPANTWTAPAHLETATKDTWTVPAYICSALAGTPNTPANTCMAPANTWTAPAYSYTIPANTWTAPAYTCTAPAKTWTAPAYSCTIPANTWTAPANTYTAQANTHTAPANTWTTPVNICNTQANTCTAQDNTWTAPANTWTAPANTGTAPANTHTAPTNTCSVPGNIPNAPSVLDSMDILTKFLLKKDILSSRLTKFNDNPEYYSVWQTTFKSVVTELGIRPEEELDLLMKWLGPGTLKQAVNIRSAYPHDPVAGIARIWERLDDQFASPEMIEARLKAKVVAFPKLTYKDTKQLYELLDLACEIQARKSDTKYSILLSYYDSSTGVNELVSKLPSNLRERWTTEGIKYKTQNNVSFPPFSVFINFLRYHAKARNDPGFKYEAQEGNTKSYKVTPQNNRSIPQRNNVSTYTTNVENSSTVSPLCPLHKTRHKLNKCRAFREKSLNERKRFLKDNSICFHCCETDSHVFKNCKTPVKCEVCQSEKHPSALHVDSTVSVPLSIHGGERSPNPIPASRHGGERPPISVPASKHGGERPPNQVVSSNCAQICGNLHGTSKSCAKILLVNVFPTGKPEQALRLYALVDDQSNQTLAKSTFFDHFGENSNVTDYTLSTCSGSVAVYGRTATGYTIESLDSHASLDLPMLVECNAIPEAREEIPTPETAFNHSHLADVADALPPLDPQADILLLIGRDLPSAHHVHDQRVGPRDGPYAQKLSLGWVVIGEVCLGNVHLMHRITTNKTFTLRNGRPSLLEPCPNCFEFQLNEPRNSFPIFCKTPQDDKLGLSIEDKEFLQIMEASFQKNSKGNWTAPLPFKPERPYLPDNKSVALHRAKSLNAGLQKDPVKRAHMFEFMSKILSGGHAEIAPGLPNDTERWFLPLFGVYHPKKPGKIRGVFDSSAKCKGISLNDVLMTGPDLVNSLLGVLLRFRIHAVAVTADVEQMFYCFKVVDKHQDYLRFLWYQDNDFSRPLVEYRMTAHVFGNSPSPAVATFGLRKTVEQSDHDVREFVTRNFYVDDALTSTPDSSSAVSLLHRTRQDLQNNGNIRLHKISSNNKTVLEAFPSSDLSGDLKDLDLQVDSAPLQRSLGVYWNLSEDVFTFRSNTDTKPYTKRGLLSVINSVFDPVGFASPVVLKGKLLFRNVAATMDWDEPLMEEKRQEWETWQTSLTDLNECCIPRQYFQDKQGLSGLHVRIYSDASKEAIAAVAYLCQQDSTQQISSSFILGKAKVAPHHGHTIPRLELCAAVLATEVGQIICEHLDLDPTTIQYYTDSTVTLGYINNRVRKFYIYVGNRVDRILNVSKPCQWKHVTTDRNPADIGTRCISAGKLFDSLWLKGPKGLSNESNVDKDDFELVLPDEDSEIRPQITSLKIIGSTSECLGTHRFNRFSTWASLSRAFATLINLARRYSGQSAHQDLESVDIRQRSQTIIIKETQSEVYTKEIKRLKNSEAIPNDSSIASLSPYLDHHGILRVGGRLNKSGFQLHETNPVIIPGKHHIAELLVHHHHLKVCHQGRHFTAGAIRSAGYWITGSKRLISSHIHKCFRCRRMRGKPAVQLMADLPTDRLTPSPPFTYVGVDIFGPWHVSFRRTRGVHSQQKRWAALFTCLVTRAVHIEVIEDMSSSCFINALRRFTSIRGPVKLLRSDRGTNFVGCTDSVGIPAINVEDDQMANHLLTNGTVWLFNPPHSSHFGGSWERMIGTARNILDSMLLDVKGRGLTHEVLTTLMAEITAIINSRPLVEVSSDPQDPHVLSPAELLTQKTSTSSAPKFPVTLDIKDAYRSQWKMVQLLADQFWRKWKTDYIQGLQCRRKWTNSQVNIKEGDIVLLRDQATPRLEWPMGIVVRVFPSEDNLVRKLELRVTRDGKTAVYVRPINEVVLLLSQD